MEKRPRLNLPFSTFEYCLEFIATTEIVLIFGVTLVAWADLPAKVPMHYDIAGQVDSFGDRGTIWILPFTSLGLYLMLSIISRFPHIFNYPWPITQANAPMQYRLARAMLIGLKAELMFIFLYLQWQGVLIAEGRSGALGWYFLPLMLVVVTGSLIVYIRIAARYR